MGLSLPKVPPGVIPFSRIRLRYCLEQGSRIRVNRMLKQFFSLRRHVWFILYVFVILEGLIYGFGLWWFSYLYVWAILCGSVFLMGWNGKPRSISAALLAGIFGMLFGLLCAVSYFFTGGIGAAFAWWTAGIPFDIVHGISNFAVTLLLFDPLYRLLSRLKNQF